MWHLFTSDWSLYSIFSLLETVLISTGRLGEKWWLLSLVQYAMSIFIIHFGTKIQRDYTVNCWIALYLFIHPRWGCKMGSHFVLCFSQQLQMKHWKVMGTSTPWLIWNFWYVKEPHNFSLLSIPIINQACIYSWTLSDISLQSTLSRRFISFWYLINTGYIHSPHGFTSEHIENFVAPRRSLPSIDSCHQFESQTLVWR